MSTSINQSHQINLQCVSELEKLCSQAGILRSLIDMAFSLLILSHGVDNFLQDFLAPSFTGCMSWLPSDNFNRQPGRSFTICPFILHMPHAETAKTAAPMPLKAKPNHFQFFKRNLPLAWILDKSCCILSFSEIQSVLCVQLDLPAVQDRCRDAWSLEACHCHRSAWCWFQDNGLLAGLRTAHCAVLSVLDSKHAMLELLHDWHDILARFCAVGAGMDQFHNHLVWCNIQLLGLQFCIGGHIMQVIKGSLLFCALAEELGFVQASNVFIEDVFVVCETRQCSMHHVVQTEKFLGVFVKCLMWSLDTLFQCIDGINVMWKSWLFPCTQSSFQARCWVPMKPLQQSCVKLKLRTRLAARAAYLKLCPRHPASVKSYCLRQEWVNKHLKHMIEFDSTAAVWPSRGCSLPQCHKQRRLWGQAPLGPNPYTTWRFSSARPRITLGYSHDKRNRKRPRTTKKSHGQRFFNTWSCLFSWLHHFGRTLSRFGPFMRLLGEHENSMECWYKPRKSWSQKIQLLTSWLAPP